MKKSFLSVLVAFSLVCTAFATEYTWTGGAGSTDTTWSTPANWNPSTGVPTTGDTATIDSGTVTMIQGEKCTLNINGGNVQFDHAIRGKVTITGNTTVSTFNQFQPKNGAYVLINGSGVQLSTDYIQITHDEDGNATFEVRDGSVSVSGFINVGNRKNYTGYYIQSGGTVNVAKDMKIGRDEMGATQTKGSVTISGGTLTLGSTLNIGNATTSTGLFTISDGIVKTTGVKLGSSTSKLTFVQNNAKPLTWTDSDGLHGGFTITDTGSCGLSYGEIILETNGLLFADSASSWTLISGGVGTISSTVSGGNLYDVAKSGNSLAATLKTGLSNDQSTVGMREFSGKEITLYTGLWNDEEGLSLFANWLKDSLPSSATVTTGEVGAVTVKLADAIPEGSKMLWDFTAFNAETGRNAVFSTTPIVPEPSTLVLALLGIACFGMMKRRA